MQEKLKKYQLQKKLDLKVVNHKLTKSNSINLIILKISK